ncbi:MAG: PhzF family phenazine biosynthesis protein [Sphingobium sp.]|uniref:PhzF family phenazine biosynthesis protein n=1 Tax=Sphingobium sp. TaxID=1912891 RepID=UPI0029B40E0B|nr:PhzF family phenazine biosynthesis protein [Sphingobium sp.]MDX3910679.1 PhzF family phenazine biosynthesis protein [Sphingobium sp.]
MQRLEHSFVTLDVFTDHTFGGNPLAIFPNAGHLDATTMQAIAGELNLSETVFIIRPDENASPRLRIFTPRVELPFAGHPTVGAAIFLAEEAGAADRAPRVLETAAGAVLIDLRQDAEGRLEAFVTSPQPPRKGPAPSPQAAAAALRIAARDLAFAPAAFSAGVPYAFVPVASRELLSQASLDPARWEESFKGAWAPAIFVFTMDDWESGREVHGRMFAPGIGITEDPATGSAAAALAGLLVDLQGIADGQCGWSVRQGEDMGRPSTIHIKATVSNGVVESAQIGGSAVRLIEGKIRC